MYRLSPDLLEATRPWSKIQKSWLKRLAKQLKKEVILDPESLDQGAFEVDGGIKTLDNIFEGKTLEILKQLKDNIWEDVG